MTPARCLSARAPRESRDAAPAMVDGHHTAYHLSCIIPIFASWLDRDARENGARRLSRCPTPTPRNQRTRYGTLCSMRVTSRSRHSSHVAGVGTHRTSALGARGTGPRSKAVRIVDQRHTAHHTTIPRTSLVISKMCASLSITRHESAGSTLRSWDTVSPDHTAPPGHRTDCLSRAVSIS